jgi:hypothetical protein
MSGMKRPSTTSLVVSLIVMATGAAGLALGGSLFVAGAATAAQTGNSGTMTGGLVLGLFGLFLLFTPPATWVGRMFQAEHRKYSAWKLSLTPQERGLVEAAEVAALAGAAVAGWEANRARSRRIGEDYQASQARSAASDALLMQTIQGSGLAGQPGVTGAPDWPGQIPEPIPGQWIAPGN